MTSRQKSPCLHANHISCVECQRGKNGLLLHILSFLQRGSHLGINLVPLYAMQPKFSTEYLTVHIHNELTFIHTNGSPCKFKLTKTGT